MVGTRSCCATHIWHNRDVNDVIDLAELKEKYPHNDSMDLDLKCQ
jgi:hypothetical protein